jgi:hypothetical protein
LGQVARTSLSPVSTSFFINSNASNRRGFELRGKDSEKYIIYLKHQFSSNKSQTNTKYKYIIFKTMMFFGLVCKILPK